MGFILAGKLKANDTVNTQPVVTTAAVKTNETKPNRSSETIDTGLKDQITATVRFPYLDYETAGHDGYEEKMLWSSPEN